MAVEVSGISRLSTCRSLTARSSTSSNVATILGLNLVLFVSERISGCCSFVAGRLPLSVRSRGLHFDPLGEIFSESTSLVSVQGKVGTSWRARTLVALTHSLRVWQRVCRTSSHCSILDPIWSLILLMSIAWLCLLSGVDGLFFVRITLRWLTELIWMVVGQSLQVFGGPLLELRHKTSGCILRWRIHELLIAGMVLAENAWARGWGCVGSGSRVWSIKVSRAFRWNW